MYSFQLLAIKCIAGEHAKKKQPGEKQKSENGTLQKRKAKTAPEFDFYLLPNKKYQPKGKSEKGPVFSFIRGR